jgi:hypothetical protein
MVALGEYRNLLCSCGCGFLREVSHAEANEFRFVVVADHCHARTAIVKASQSETLYMPESAMFHAELRE